MSEWETEELTDSDELFLRVHGRQLDKKGELHPGIFRPRPPRNADGEPDETVPKEDWGISTYWSEYSTPSQCRAGGGSPASNNGVVTLIVKEVRAVPPLTVQHTPEPNNRSHTDVFGLPVMKQKKVKVRKRLFRHVKERGWTIHPNSPVEDPIT